ncbi:MAG: hypothetical protein QM528_08350 [Phycisphaerales bacterium]|nr:hypothetical protein [Phycisphaerales bacterium]
MYFVRYTSDVINAKKVLSFTVKDIFGNTRNANDTFNVRDGFVAKLYPTLPSVKIGALDTVVVNIRSVVSTGSYTFQLNNMVDSLYYKNQAIANGETVPFTNLSGDVTSVTGAFDTLIYKAYVTSVGMIGINYTVTNTAGSGSPQTCTVNINILPDNYYFLIGKNASGTSAYTTSKNGIDWSTPKLFNANLTSIVNAVAFSSGSNGVAVTNNGSFMRTMDGGMTWSNPARIGSNITDAILVKFSTVMNGVIVGDNGYYSYTRDAGATWSTPNQISGFSPSDMAFSSATTGVIVGDYGLYSYTSNGGITWSTTKTGPVSNYISGVTFAPAKTITGQLFGAMTLASDYTAYSTDSGQTWIAVIASGGFVSATSGPGYSSPTNLAFIATASDPLPNNVFNFFTSSDGGVTTNRTSDEAVPLGSFSGIFRSLTFFAETTAQSSSNGILLHTASNQYGMTTNGGTSYTVGTSPLSINTWLTVNKDIVWQ